MRTEEWVQEEKMRIQGGFNKIDTEYDKTVAEFSGMTTECTSEDAKKLSYLIGKMRKLSEEKMQNRGKIKLINKILEIKC